MLFLKSCQFVLCFVTILGKESKVNKLKEAYAEYYLQIGLKIAYYRKLRGLTQEQLAEQIGRSTAFVGHVEAPNIQKAVSLDTLFSIADVLDVPPYKFLQFDLDL
jgi:DNA-binding XRE family transcriptional regulator